MDDFTTLVVRGSADENAAKVVSNSSSSATQLGQGKWILILKELGGKYKQVAQDSERLYGTTKPGQDVEGDCGPTDEIVLTLWKHQKEESKCEYSATTKDRVDSFLKR